MSRQSRRGIARSGLVFRDGQFVNKVEWDAGHKSKSQIKKDAAEFVEKFKRQSSGEGEG